MTFNQLTIEENVISEILALMPGYTFYDEAVPAASTLKSDASGIIRPYIVYQISDIQYNRKGSFAGVRRGEYAIDFDFQIVTTNAKVSKQIRAHMNNLLLGFKPTKSGELHKQFSIGNWIIVDEESKPQAYVSSLSFRANITLVTGSD